MKKWKKRNKMKNMKKLKTRKNFLKKQINKMIKNENEKIGKMKQNGTEPLTPIRNCGGYGKKWCRISEK